MLKQNVILMAVAVLASVILLAGCAPSNDVAVSVKPSNGGVSKDGLDPVTKGKIRRQILDDTQENIAIWLEGDTQNLGKAFTKEYLNTYEAQIDKLHAEGKDKVRIHENQDLEVSELSDSMATVSYKFKDKSYFIAKSTGKVIKEPTNKDSEIVITVVKQGGRWKVQLLLGSADGII